MKRRIFLKDGCKASAFVLVSGSIASTFASCKAPAVMQGKIYNNTPGLTQAPLGYSYNSLEPVIDAQTMELHYSKHAAGYAKNLGEAIAAEAPGTTRLENIFADMSKYSTKMRNNAGGHYNHERFWRWMTPNGNKGDGTIMKAIDQRFGSMDAFTKQFNEAATTRFGSGWAWLMVNRDGALQIGSTPNQDNPLMSTSDIKGFPILGLDVWEHAYYLKYQNKRADYINAWWKVVNWQEVENGYRFATNA